MVAYAGDTARGTLSLQAPTLGCLACMNAVCMINLHRPFCQRPEKGRIINFLKGLAPDYIGADLPDEKDHRQ